MISLVAMLLSACSTKKHVFKEPEIKQAVVSEENSFQDKLKFAFDDKGLDLNVNMAFDETSNLLTLSLTGNRQLMVFKQDVLYKRVFKHPFIPSRRLDPKKLPYPVLIQPKLKVKMAKKVYKSYPRKRRFHIFNNWLVGTSPELQMIAPTVRSGEQPEATLIVDSIVQRFRVNPKATKASFTLRNLLVADKDGMPIARMQLKRKPNTSLTYQIVDDHDLNLTYEVKIQRNPCFGQDSLIAATQSRIVQVSKALKLIREACPTGIVHSEEEEGIFKQHKQYLLSQFPAISDSSACTTLQDAYKHYNLYVDSIAKLSCTLVPLIPTEESNGTYGIGVRASTILEAAHRLDNLVSQIMVTHDAVQVHDLTVAGRNIITTLTRTVHENGLIDDEQRSAYEIFLKAKTYFNSTVAR